MAAGDGSLPTMSDFDFLHGEWDVTNSRLTTRLDGGGDWEEFPGSSTCHGFFGGAGNFDEITFPTKGFSGATMRVRNQETGEWSIHWVDSRTGRMDPPMVGRFADGVGTFYGDDTHQGRPVRVRFIWSRITPSSARWEQAFSVDNGRNWETNWVMDFARK